MLVFCQDRVFLPESLLRMSLTISSCPASVALQYQMRKWSIKERFQAIQLVNKLQQCCYVIKLLQGCHLQLADKLLNCKTITSCWTEQLVNKSVELNNLVASCQQAGNKQCEHILLKCCWNSIDTSLLQVCYNLCVLRVYTKRLNLTRLNSLPTTYFIKGVTPSLSRLSKTRSLSSIASLTRLTSGVSQTAWMKVWFETSSCLKQFMMTSLPLSISRQTCNVFGLRLSRMA